MLQFLKVAESSALDLSGLSKIFARCYLGFFSLGGVVKGYHGGIYILYFIVYSIKNMYMKQKSVSMTFLLMSTTCNDNLSTVTDGLQAVYAKRDRLKSHNS